MLASGLPAGAGSIDLLAVDAEGRLVLVTIEPEPGEAEAARGLARALAHRAWVCSDMPGWLALVPDVVVGPGTHVRSLLLLRACPPVVRAAIGALPPGWIEPVVHRPYRHRGDRFLLLEQGMAAETWAAGTEPAFDEHPERLPDAGAAVKTAPLPAFRSGLTRADFPATSSSAPRRGRERGRPRFEAAHEPTPRPASPRDPRR